MRTLTGPGLVVVALTTTLAALIFPVWSYADRSVTGPPDLNAGSVSTRWGPLSAADRDFVLRLRLAGLWEEPAGQQAVKRAPTASVADAGRHLMAGHALLDAQVREVAARLALRLPDRPDAQQRSRLKRLTADRGVAYERDFATLLRGSHGQLFSLVALIRASTRNSLIRGLADNANRTVLDHMEVLEATGLVDFDDLARASAADTTAGPPPSIGGTPAPPVPVTASPVFPLPPPASRPRASASPATRP